ncbi:MAG: hypothetical protein GXY48_05630 [Methanomicrobiales archaeon]|nr:hypothetical protein [Methanomicrobiales archaeon]
MAKYCVECGSELIEGAQYCEQCGGFIGESESFKETNPEPAAVYSKTKFEGSSPESSFFSVILKNARNITIIGIILLILSFFIPSQLSMELSIDPAETTEENTYGIKVIPTKISSLQRILDFISDIKPDYFTSLIDIVLLIIAICMAITGFVKYKSQMVCIAGIIGAVSFVLNLYTLGFYHYFGGLIITGSVIVAIIGYMKNKFKFFVISVCMLLLGWILDYYLNPQLFWIDETLPDYIILWWSLVTVGGIISLLLSGAVQMTNDSTS